MTLCRPATFDQCVEAVRSADRIAVRGAGTKPAMIRSEPSVTVVETNALSGVTEYDPSEFTITAMAGTPLAEVMAELARHDQWLPFDPPLADAGATLGGTVAAGLSGASRLRHGGVRDFLVGIRFVDGSGHHLVGGGRVVKNAAGFDLPKFMIGSAGRFGLLTELTFKVFPTYRAARTCHFSCEDVSDVLARLAQLGRQPLELQAADFDPTGRMAVRLAADPDALDGWMDDVCRIVDRPMTVQEDEKAYWESISALAWVPEGHAVLKLAVSPQAILRLDALLAEFRAVRRYSVAGHLAWIAVTPDQIDVIDQALHVVGIGGVMIRGGAPRMDPWLGIHAARPFWRRIKSALDPQSRFGEI